MTEQSIKEAKITDFQPDPTNPNKGNERGNRILNDSLSELGAGRSLVVDKNGIVIAGNKTQENAVDIGLEDVIVVPTDGTKLVVVQRTDLDLINDSPDKKARRLSIADNRTSDFMEWDAEVMARLEAEGIPLEEWFTEDELTDLFADLPADEAAGEHGDGEAEMERAAELLLKWKVERGQVWAVSSLATLGSSHRIMCGDSTSADDVAKLMAGAKSGLMLTDPPYNVAQETLVYGQDSSKALKDLAESEWDRDFDPVAFLEATKSVFKRDCWQYVFTAHHLFGTVFGWLNSNHDKTSFNVWCKPNPMPSLAKKTWTFATELCLHGRSGAPIFNFPDGEHCLNWWAINKNSDGSHPTQKPLELFRLIIERCSAQGDLIVDPFLGSGTTLVACEQTGRLGYGCEIDPGYTAVCLERLSNMGLVPQKVE